MLHAPDFLGYEDGHPDGEGSSGPGRQGARLKKIGNDLMVVIGGREIHPINVRVGGFYRAPYKAELDALIEPLEWALNFSLEAVRFTSGLTFPSSSATTNWFH